MAEYIERGETIDQIIRWGYTADRPRTWMNGIDKSIEIVKAIPSADVQPVRHGRWENINDLECFKCSCCGEYANQPWGKDGAIMFSYCPNCGAKMGGGEA